MHIKLHKIKYSYNSFGRIKKEKEKSGTSRKKLGLEGYCAHLH